jgi:hypothetical protein
VAKSRIWIIASALGACITGRQISLRRDPQQSGITKASGRDRYLDDGTLLTGTLDGKLRSATCALRRHSLGLARVDAISSGICIHSAQPPLNCLEIKIFDGRFSRSAARRVFHPLFRHAASFANSIALPRILLPAFQILSREVGFVDRESNSIRASIKIVCGYPVLSATVTAESAETPKFPRISAAAARRRRVKLKIAIFCGLPAVAGGIPALPLEIQKFSGKFKSSAGNSPKPCEVCGC